MKLQKLGGFASFALVGLFIALGVLLARISLLFGLTSPVPPSTDLLDPAKMMAAYLASPVTFHLFDLSFILWGIMPILIALALQERTQANAPNLMRLAFTAASISFALFLTFAIADTIGAVALAASTDISSYRAFLVIVSGISGAGDNTCGWAFLFMGWAALKTRALSRILSYLMMAYGIIAIFQSIFQINMPLAVVMEYLPFIVSLLWLGVAFFRKQEPSPAKALAAARG